MRKTTALGSFALVSAVALVWAGCQAQKTTELVAGVSTQVQVPRDVKSIRIDVAVGGTPAFCQAYAVYDGHVQLPRTLGTLPAHDVGTAVTITVSAFTESSDTSNVAALAAGCTYAPRVGGEPATGGGARVLRISRQPYSQDQILYVPMPLKYSCFDVDCSNSNGDQTCKAGQCVAPDTDVTKLVAFDESVIFGNDSTCFSVYGSNGCFPDIATVAPLTVDDDNCVYAFPGGVGAPALPPGVSLPQLPSGVTLPPDGLNVRVSYDGGVTKEILDLDPVEGFTIPDGSTPQIFKLADGLCKMVHGAGASTHRITAIEVSPICRPKLASQSICKADQLTIVGANPDGTASNPTGTCTTAQLAPVQAAVEFVVDPTAKAADFYAAAGALIPKLSDPGLRNLLVGVQFIPDGTSTCPAASTLAAHNLTATLTGSLGPYLSGLGALGPLVAGNANQDLGVSSALTAAYADLNANGGSSVNKSIIIVASSGLLQSCPTAGGKTPAALISASSATGVNVSVVEVGSTPEGACQNGALLSAVGPTGCITKTGSGAQQAILKDLTAAASCTYTYKQKTPPDAVWFTDPTNPSITNVATLSTAGLAACRASGLGFAVDASNNLVFCKATCDAYQSALANAAALLSASSSGTDGGSSGSTTKLPTIIPVFAMTGNACIPPQSSGGGGTSGVDGSAPQVDGGITTATDSGAHADSGSGADASASTCGKPTISMTGASLSQCANGPTDQVFITWQCGATSYATGCRWPNAAPTPTQCDCYTNGAITGSFIPGTFGTPNSTCSQALLLPTTDFDRPAILNQCGFSAVPPNPL